MHNDNAFYTRPGMAAFGSATAARPGSRADACADPCPPSCPSCGGLQCLCRPRFFPGQLLTDDTLNQLSRYIVEKNKLHNRHLQGWGVACGLEVSCDPCNPQQVVVGTGYALAPCGDDIVVCNEQAVNICELIDACTPQRQPRCDPPYERTPQDCRGGNNRWVLAICYDERPSRGVTALLGAGDSSCKAPCRCGGASGCHSCGGSGCGGGASCSCGGKGAASDNSRTNTNYNSQPRKTRQVNCEPTQVCEGYRFVAYPAPKHTGVTDFPGTEGHGGFLNRLLAWLYTNRAKFGPLIERLLCCMSGAQDLLQDWGKGQKMVGPQALDAYVQYAQAMVNFTNEFNVHKCAFVAKAQRLYDSAIEFANSTGDVADLTAAQQTHIKAQLDQLDVTLMDIVSECLCSALLPPCPVPVQDNCVPLAVVTLRSNNCQVVDICNWQERKLLITWPNMSYWLSWLPWHCLREAIAKFCCGTGRNSVVQRMLSLVLGMSVLGAACGKKSGTQDDNPAARDVVGAGVGLAGIGQPPQALPVNRLMGQPAAASANAVNAGERVQDDDLVMQLLEMFDRTRSGQSGAPAWAKLAARASDGSLLDDIASVGGVGGVAEMQAQVSALIRTVQAQQVQLDALQKRTPGPQVVDTPDAQPTAKAVTKKAGKPAPRQPK